MRCDEMTARLDPPTWLVEWPHEARDAEDRGAGEDRGDEAPDTRWPRAETLDDHTLRGWV